MDINAERQKRAGLAKQARAILDAAENDKGPDGKGRDLTPEESEKFDRIMEECDASDLRVEREEKTRAKERNVDADPDDAGDRNGPDNPGGGDKDEVERAFRDYLVKGRGSLTEAQMRALNAGNDPEGGFLVAPERFTSELLKAVDDQVLLRPLANVMQLTDAESLGVPTLDTDLQDAEWTSEIGTGSQDDALRLGKRELTPNPLAKRVKVSRKLLRLTSGRAEDLVRDRMAYKFAVSQEKAYMTGDGNKKPLGLFIASAAGISTSRDVDFGGTGGGAGTIPLTNVTGDQLIDAKYALKAAYWNRAQWLFHRDIVKVIRKLKDGDGNYVWNRGLQTDQPDTILDLRYLVSEFAPNTVGTDQYVGMLGDYMFYQIVDSLSFEVQRLVELYAETNQVGFIGRYEGDGMPVLEEPFVRLHMPAS